MTQYEPCPFAEKLGKHNYKCTYKKKCNYQKRYPFNYRTVFCRKEVKTLEDNLGADAGAWRK